MPQDDPFDPMPGRADARPGDDWTKYERATPVTNNLTPGTEPMKSRDATG